MDTNVVGIRDPLTKSHVESLTGLYLTSHPFFYNGSHLTNQGRLTKVTFRKPKTMMMPNIYGVVSEKWDGSLSNPCSFDLTPIGKRYVPMGFNGFYYNDIQAEPELLIINPKEFVTGAILSDFEQEAIRKLFLIHNVTYGVVSAFNSVLPMCSDFELRL